MSAVSTTGLSSTLDTIVDRQPHPTAAGCSMLVRRSDGCILSVQPVQGLPIAWRDPKNPPPDNPNWTPGGYEACLVNGATVVYAPDVSTLPQALILSYAETLPNG